jgi:hypothetical protein
LTPDWFTVSCFVVSAAAIDVAFVVSALLTVVE